MSKIEPDIHIGFVPGPGFSDMSLDVFKVPEAMVEAHERLLTVFDPDQPPLVNGLQRMIDGEDSELIVAINGEMPKLQSEWNNLSPEQYVGSLTLLFVQTLTKPVAHIEHVMVDPNFRGRKTGSQLVGLAIDETRAREVIRIDLTSGASKKEAQGLYAKMGFKTRDTINWRWQEN